MAEAEWQITRERLACPWCSDEVDTTELELKWEQNIACDLPDADHPFKATLDCTACRKQFDVEGDLFVEWRARRVRHLQALPNS